MTLSSYVDVFDSNLARSESLYNSAVLKLKTIAELNKTKHEATQLACVMYWPFINIQHTKASAPLVLFIDLGVNSMCYGHLLFSIIIIVTTASTIIWCTQH